MKRVLFINHGLGNHCGVHSYGERYFESIRCSEKLDVLYAEPTSFQEYSQIVDGFQPDVTFFNYMSFLLPWVEELRHHTWREKRVVMQHLYDPQSVGPIMDSYRGLFDYMIILDPSLVSPDPRVFAVGRPIPLNVVAPRELGTHVEIGSFGFGMPHKQFHLIAREINSCFDDATFNLHMTVGDFTGDYSQGIIESVEAELTKPGVNLNWTSNYLTDDEIVDKMSQNDMNALFYALPPDNAGLSSAADYMVAAQRPLLVSDCASFKHVHYGTYQWPSVTFSDIAGNWNWCQNHSFELYERMVGKLQADVENMIERIL